MGNMRKPVPSRIPQTTGNITMNSAAFTYWPFAVLPPEERTELHRQEIQFFETAFHEGFRPCESLGVYKACSDEGREGWIIDRGRVRPSGPGRWEVRLVIPSTELDTMFWVDDFDCAANSVLQWLRGIDASMALAAAAGHYIKEPSTVFVKFHDLALNRRSREID